MISDQVYLLPVESITVGPARREIDPEHVATLAESIAQNDLIHTLVVEEGTNILCAGAHRLAAWKQNKEANVPTPNPAYKDWTLIPIRFAQNFNESDLARIELIENLQHKQLSWIEEMRGIQKIHQIQSKLDGTWTQAKTGELLRISRANIVRALAVADVYEKYKDDLGDCSTIRSAYAIIERKTSRKKAKVFEGLTAGKVRPTLELDDIIEGKEQELVEIEPEPIIDSPIVLGSFHDYAANYSGPRFNLLHCDFPYGINLHKSEGQGTRKDASFYDDSEEIYWDLLHTLAKHQDSLCAESCHIIFWFSMNHYERTLSFFKKQMRRFTVQSHPLIWHRSDQSGLCPDPQRYGRRTYETALCLVSGDRKIVKVKNLSFAHPHVAGFHRSEKPLEVVRHFLEMFVDKDSIMLDPTCGSGTALRAARNLGATVAGVEIDPEMHQHATEEFAK